MSGDHRTTPWGVVLTAVLLFMLGLPALPPGDETTVEFSETQQSRYAQNTAGRESIYIIKEIVEITSDHGSVDWLKGPRVLASRHRILEGAEAPDLYYHVSGLDVRIGKRQFNTTRVVLEVEALALRGDATVSAFIDKGAAEAVRADLYAYEPGGGGFVLIASFHADGFWGDAFRSDLSLLYEMPAAMAAVEDVTEDLKKGVYAFYYPWYGNPAGPSRQWVHWDEDGSAHSPLLGPYDSGDDDVILAHLAIAKDAGIDGFISSWWGNGTFEDRQLDGILRMAEQAGMKVTIYYETVRGRLSQARVVAELTYVLETYASSPAFLRSAGRPVLFIYGAQLWEQEFWLEVRREVETAAGPVVLIGDVFDEAYLRPFDGFHSYGYLDPGIEGFYGEARKRLEVGLRPTQDPDDAFASAYAGNVVNVDRKAFALSATPGFDTSYREPAGFKLEREGGALYHRYWEAAIAIEASMVLITSWNGWHEGTEVEPSREYGFEYIQLTKQFVQEYKATTFGPPEVDFSATLLPFELTQGPEGQGAILLAAGVAHPMVMAKVEVRGGDGVRSVNLEGDFRSYLREQNGSSVSVVVPAVPMGTELTIPVSFTLDSSAVGSPSGLFDVSVSAHDPSGTLHVLIGERDGATEVPGPSTATTIAIISTGVAFSVAAIWLLWKWSGTKRRRGQKKS